MPSNFDPSRFEPIAALSTSISIGQKGPYRLEGLVDLVDHLGVKIAFEGSVDLCRCGRSQTKPFCDGSHVTPTFNGNRDPHRVADRLVVYSGQQATLFDNRGLCAHSGFCTDRLNGVFHAGSEPFVTPSGARFDEILHAVRRCPSGALGIGMEQSRDEALTDPVRPPRVEVSKDGPYRVSGSIRLFDENGAPALRPDGASLEHYSLCRCGASQNKPFCSGMHWTAGFSDPAQDPNREPTLFEWAGGYPALLDMTRIFYSRYVPEDPLIGPLFADMSPDHPERVAAWLGEVFGGPLFYSERYGGYSRMISQHVGKGIRPEQRKRWADLMLQSAEDAGLPADAEFRAAFAAYIEWGSRIAVENSQSDGHPPPNMPVPRWWWVCDATPGARISALAQPEKSLTASASLAPDETPTFANHVKPLFRPMDRNSMKFAFDLWNEGDLRLHGDAILARLKAGTMPCDGAWPAERVAIFERWLRDPGHDYIGEIVKSV
jgi:CDGSH-type Zn-finger protein/truncated hemoglobin YjbI